MSNYRRQPLGSAVVLDDLNSADPCHTDHPGRRLRLGTEVVCAASPLEVPKRTTLDGHSQRGNIGLSHSAYQAFVRSLWPDMKVFLGIFALALVAATIFADYKWKQWIAARRQEREHTNRRDDPAEPR